MRAKDSDAVIFKPTSIVVIVGISCLVGAVLDLIVGSPLLFTYLGIGVGFGVYALIKDSNHSDFVSGVTDRFLSTKPHLLHVADVDESKRGIKKILRAAMLLARRHSWKNSSTRGFSITELSLALRELAEDSKFAQNRNLILELDEYLNKNTRIKQDEEADQLDDPKSQTGSWWWPI